MKTWFMSLQPRERLIVLGGAVAAALIVLWGGMHRLDRATTALRDSVATQQQLLIDLAQLEGNDASAPSANRSDEPSLLNLVTNTASAQGLTFPRTRPDGADAMNVTFQNASFDSLLAWLVMLETQHGVTVDTASFSSSREPGLVSGQIFLRRK